jgi:tetratricopeptide (TPR) repeat protein
MRFFALGLIVVAWMATTASARVWTNAVGNKIEAEYLGVEQGMVKLAIRESGRVTNVPLGQLSEADQKWVQEQVAKAEAEARAAAGPPDRFTQAIMDDPTNPQHYLTRGIAMASRGNFDGAVRDFTKAIELDPENANAHNGRGLAYHRAGDLVAAQQDFNEAIKLDPALQSAYQNRGRNLQQLALDKTRSVPELDEEIERWQRFWNYARQANLRNTPWQPLNATKGDVSRPAIMLQMAQTDLEFARNLHRHYGGHHGGHGGHGGHGHGCSCPACSGTACAHCNDRGCAACNGGKPAPGLGVYPPQVMKGETITLVANAAMLAQGMPTEAKPGRKPGPNAPRIPVDSVDFYRDVDGDGIFNAATDQYLGTDSDGSQGFSLEVSTAAFPPGPQSYFAVPRGGAGSGSGSSPQEMMAAAQRLEQAAQRQQAVADACAQGAEQGLSEEQARSLARDQSQIADDCAECVDQFAGAAPELAKMLDEARRPMNAIRNLMNSAQKRPGEESKGDAENAAGRARDTAERLAELAAKTREAAEAAIASAAENPGQAPPDAAAGAPTSGANEILAAAPIGPRGFGGGPGGDGYGGDDRQYDEEVVVTEEIIEDEIVDRARDYIDRYDYDSAVYEYDRALAVDPLNVSFLRDRAATQLLRGSYDHAIRDYDRLLTVQEEPDANLYYNRGCAHLAAGRLQEALSDFTKSISLNEVWSLAYNNRGATYARLREYDKAVSDFTKAIELEPGNSLAYRNRALAYRKLGDMQRAQEDLQYMIRLEKAESATGVQ